MTDERPHLRTTRTAYDDIAALYTEMFGDPRRLAPLDRAMISGFAETVRGPVLDAGCGPGRVTAYLRGLGRDASGVDLSPEMIGHARAAHPGISFSEGTIAALDAADGSFGGVLSWYSVIHTPPELLPEIFAEFHRVLTPGGHLLLGFFATAGETEPQPYDHKVTAAYCLPVDHVGALLAAAGFTEIARMEREPADDERRRHGRLLAVRSRPAGAKDE
ncbi:class I SAM-dependent DNA methyltransferase [Actinomadura roseirufa]|uniref:class I SAM-dependent DNA methyltransferase n=1 Tax=Actinomadura roseirufa TaxID=2094049 RepID=UPI0010413727|nr:class I SAM-dependent methyltransferase [Actinomadura roseirufa]